MADAKTQYQVLRANFYNKELPNRTDLTGRYKEAKRKLEMHKDEWGKISVNINEVVEKFTGNAPGESHDLKCLYKGKRYYVIADYVGYYLRIHDIINKVYVKLDGTPCLTPEERNAAHYRIKTREEM